MKKILLAGILLAIILLISMNISLNIEKIEDYKKNCDIGSPVACNKLGFMYYAGRSVKQDDLKAVELYMKACNGGEATACSSLGFMYRNGIGVKRDNLKAIKFYTKACNAGDTPGFTVSFAGDLEAIGASSGNTLYEQTVSVTDLTSNTNNAVETEAWIAAAVAPCRRTRAGQPAFAPFGISIPISKKILN